MTEQKTMLKAAIRKYIKDNDLTIEQAAQSIPISGTRLRGVLTDNPRPATIETLFHFTQQLGIRFELVQTS